MTDEITVGDNDQLACQVAKLVGAERLVLLTSVDGLLDADGKDLGVRVSRARRRMPFVPAPRLRQSGFR